MQRFIDEKEDLGLWSDDNNSDISSAGEGEQHRALNEEMAQLDEGEQLRAPHATDSPETKRKFHPGQSMIQWWASWFKTATVVPALYNKTNRPAWFSGEVLAHAGYKSMKYAGIQQEKQYVYVCY